MVDIRGGVTVTQAGRGAELLSAFSVHVKVPLIRKSIEKRIVTEIKQSLEPIKKLTEEFCSVGSPFNEIKKR